MVLLVEARKRHKLNQELMLREKEINEIYVTLILRNLIDEIERTVNKIVHLRANLMFLNERKKLSIRFQINMEGCSDLDLQWDQGVGCVGESYQKGLQIIGDLTRVSSAKWGLSKEQIEQTKHIKSILSTPIFLEDKAIAVLNIDSRLSTHKAGFDRLAIQKLCKKVANDLGFLFKKFKSPNED